MQTHRLALRASDRMITMLEGFEHIYQREHPALSDAELITLYDLLARYLSELHDDCLTREGQRTAKQRGKGRAA